MDTNTCLITVNIQAKNHFLSTIPILTHCKNLFKTFIKATKVLVKLRHLVQNILINRGFTVYVMYYKAVSTTYNKQLLWQVPTIIDASIHRYELLYSGLVFHTGIV